MSSNAEKINYITEWLASYKQKIELLNAKGLFDEAKMFELFAIDVCNIYFDDKFSNLNTDKPNFAYLDLVSSDNKTYVQVSTTKNAKSKIQTTLDNLDKTTKEEYKDIEKVIFFMLTNEKSKIDNKITVGKFTFSIDSDLITIDDIINTANSDTNFLNSLYSIIKLYENDIKNNVNAFDTAIDISNNRIKQIDNLINNEYSIDRSKQIEELKAKDQKYIIIEGDAGTGKTAFCKDFLKNEFDNSVTLFARAERFLEETNINDIWNLNINTMLKLLNDKKIYFFIDSLEFISDCTQTKIDLLKDLFSLIKENNNAYLIASCRSSEINSFVNLKSLYNIYSYKIEPLTDDELKQIRTKYELIDVIYKKSNYNDILSYPFYINLIVTQNHNLDEIENEISFRNYVWEKIICQKDNLINYSQKYGYSIKYNQIVEEIEKIVFNRAKNFLIGIDESEIDSNVLRILTTNNITTVNDHKVRLKYDIYEDICFEQKFDYYYETCKGNYSQFYNNIESYGKCVYRRYQIWVSNKLLGNLNRKKFLYHLLFKDSIPSQWKTQTEIGIIKSNYCESFFDEFSNEIIDNNLLNEFIENINLYAFNIEINYIGKEPILMLTPIGDGRNCILKILTKYDIYKQVEYDNISIIKLCDDYIKMIINNSFQDVNLFTNALTILRYFADNVNIKLLNYSIHDIEYNKLTMSLQGIFQVSSLSKEWIDNFLKSLITNLKANNTHNFKIYNRITNWILNGNFSNLFNDSIEEICELAKTFWTYTSSKRNKFYPYSNEELYGLNHNASIIQLNDNFSTIDNFINCLLYANYNKGLDWCINFINNCVTNLIHNDNDNHNISKISLIFLSNGSEKEYYYHPKFWVAGTIKYTLPEIIGKIIFNLKVHTIHIIDVLLKKDTNIAKSFAKKLKNKIYNESNSTILLTIIQAIGNYFINELPAYSIDLITSIELIHNDISKVAELSNSTTKTALQQRLNKIFSFKEQSMFYSLYDTEVMSLQQYVLKTQIIIEDKSVIYNILDYLYTKIENTKETALDYLQIKKMDLRSSEIKQIDTNIIEISANLDGPAKNIIEKNRSKNNKRNVIITRANEILKEKEYDLNELLGIIDCIIQLRKEDLAPFQYDNLLYILVGTSLLNKNLNYKKRNAFCNMWIKDLKKEFNDQVFLGDSDLLMILFRQLTENINNNTKNKIKMFMLDCILYNKQFGLIDDMVRIIKLYLSKNTQLSLCLYNTVIKISEDEMNHQKYNANYYKLNHNDNFEFLPNLSHKLWNIDEQIEKNNKQIYQSKKTNIVKKYLFKEEPLVISTFDIDNYDFSTLCCITNTSQPLSNKSYKTILKSLINEMIKIINKEPNIYTSGIVNIYNLNKLITFLQEEITKSKEIIDMLFDNIDFNLFNSETIEKYQMIFINFLPYYFDAKSDNNVRHNYELLLKHASNKIDSIKDEYIKKELHKCSFMSATNTVYGDWSKLNAEYSYSDKMFLKKQFSKYGKFHLKDVLLTIYKLKIDELLPEILISISDCIDYQKQYNAKLTLEMNDSETKFILNKIILKAYVNCRQIIKSDDELTNAYENILNTLITLKYAGAPLLLDNFHVF